VSELRLPPGLAAALREGAMTLGRIGYRALSAGVAEALKGVSEITGEADARVKRGERAARKMADTGRPYDPNEPEVEDERR
jgi:hypothetical protein